MRESRLKQDYEGMAGHYPFLPLWEDIDPEVKHRYFSSYSDMLGTFGALADPDRHLPGLRNRAKKPEVHLHFAA
jgi:hypothetical protein